MDELKSVNLSKFVSEAVSYICEAKLRSAGIQAAVQGIDDCNVHSPQYISKYACVIEPAPVLEQDLLFIGLVCFKPLGYIIGLFLL